jgi:hypothetical protein
LEAQVPIKSFIHFDFKDWVAGLASQPSFEEQMDSAWKGATSPSDDMHDIFNDTFLQVFHKTNGKHFSLGGGCKSNLTESRRELHLSLAKGKSKYINQGKTNTQHLPSQGKSKENTLRNPG